QNPRRVTNRYRSYVLPGSKRGPGPLPPGMRGNRGRENGRRHSGKALQSAFSYRGNERVKALPAPGSLVTVISPLSSSAIFFATGRLIPTNPNFSRSLDS